MPTMQQLSTFVFCLFGLWASLVAAATKPRGMLGPSILHSDPDDEEIIVSSGQGWGSGSGHLPLDGFDQEDDEDDSEGMWYLLYLNCWLPNHYMALHFGSDLIINVLDCTRQFKFILSRRTARHVLLI